MYCQTNFRHTNQCYPHRHGVLGHKTRTSSSIVGKHIGTLFKHFLTCYKRVMV